MTVDPSWRDDAACLTVDPELFFGDDGTFQKEAKQVCAGCDVINECLTAAYVNREQYGIFGGLTAHQRRRRKGTS